MIPHHQGAVDMCEALVIKLACKTWGDLGDLEGMVHFCNHVNLEQKRELAIMQKWLAGIYQQMAKLKKNLEHCTNYKSMHLV